MELGSIEEKDDLSTASTSTDSTVEMEVEAGKLTDMFSGKVFVLVTGKTFNAHLTIMKILKTAKTDLLEVEKVDESDYVLVFCPVVSRAGTDIEAALKKLQRMADTKPALLVVLHHTFQTDCVVPVSSKAVNRKNCIAVDCLFHEDHGLLQCPKNTNSLKRIINIINPIQDWTWFPGVPSVPSWVYPTAWFSSPVIKGQSQITMGAETKEKDSALRILVLGEEDSKKRSVINIILGKVEEVSTATAIDERKKTEGEVAGNKVTIVKTPDLFSAEHPVNYIRKNVEEAIQLSKPGPHVFLLVIPLPILEEVNTAEESKVSHSKMEEIFGNSCWKHTLILFSVTDESVKNTFNPSENENIQTLVEKCGNRYHFLNIEESVDGFQVRELLEKIKMMVGENGENIYSSGVYLKTIASIGEIEKMISSKLEERDDPATELMRNISIQKEKAAKRKHEPEQEEEMEQSSKVPKFENENRGNRGEAIGNVCEEEDTEKERNKMKTFLSGIWKKCLNSSMKMQEEMENDNKMHAKLIELLHFPEEQHST